MYDRVVIDAGQLGNGLWMGSVLILIALAPGLVQRCMDSIRFSRLRSMLPGMRLFPFLEQTPFAFEPPRWLPLVGVAIMLAAILAYIS